jgi:HSP20 family molecular chaperone IbpA
VKTFLTNKWSWILVAFLLGLDLGWRAHRWINGEKGIRFDSQDEVRDPLAEMRQLQERMLRNFGGFDGMDSGDLKEREDDKFVYFDIEFNGQTPENLQVKVEDGQVAILGKLEMNSGGGSGGAAMSSSFHRSFPVPENVIGEKFEIEQEGSKIVIRFPKQ